MVNKEIRVKSLIAAPNDSIDYPGIILDIEDEDGNRIPLINAEIVDNRLNLYIYSDQYSDDYTHKFTMDLTKNDRLPSE